VLTYVVTEFCLLVCVTSVGIPGYYCCYYYYYYYYYRTTVTDRVRFKLAVLMYRCLHGTAPSMDSCTLTADVTGRQHLRCATQRKLIVPRNRLNGFGRRRFAVAGPSTWNSLPDSLRDPELSLNTFERQLKTYIFYKILTTERTKRIGDFFEYALMKFTLFLLTYLFTTTITITTMHTWLLAYVTGANIPGQSL